MNKTTLLIFLFVAGCAFHFNEEEEEEDDLTTPASACPFEEMAPVAEGEFMMGCNEDVDVECDVDEFPFHAVYLPSFCIDIFEVANWQYRECVSKGICGEPDEWYGDEEYPVVYIGWDDADTYCQWAGKRLPTEAEWEKAARGDDGRKYPWGNYPPDCDLANYSGCTEETKPVGSHPDGASPYGVQDMSGNVEEWVNDWYGEIYYEESPYEDPEGPAGGEYRVLRGGSFGDRSHSVRASNRSNESSGASAPGFRCAVDI